MIFEGACTADIYFLFVVVILLPALRYSGPRVIMMDNLGAHGDQELKNIARLQGHTIIFRPIHSPDFGPVEWVFQAANMHLQEHHHLINGNTLRPALNAFLDLVTNNEIASYFACAHHAVPGHAFSPYLGQN
jgi:hypothetical protein